MRVLSIATAAHMRVHARVDNPLLDTRTHTRWGSHFELPVPQRSPTLHLSGQSTRAAPLSSTSDTRRARVVVKARLEGSAQARTIRGTERESSVDVADPIHPDDVSRHIFCFLVYHPSRPRRDKSVGVGWLSVTSFLIRRLFGFQQRACRPVPRRIDARRTR